MNNFIENFKACMTTKFAQFSGTASRSEFWLFVLATAIISIILGIVGAAIPALSFLSTLASLIFFIPSLAVGARRLRDAGFSPWWLLIYITGIGALVLLIMWCIKSK